MGRARDLSMGKRSYSRHGANSGPYAKLRTIMAKPRGEVDTAKLRAILEEIGASTERLRLAEGRLYTEGCAFYRELTGEDFGPQQGMF